MSMSKKTSQRFTLIELLVVIAIIAILAAMLMPALGKVKGSGRKAACLNKHKQVYIGCNRYMADFNDYFPRAQMTKVSPGVTTAWRVFMNNQGYIVNKFAEVGCPETKMNNLSLNMHSFSGSSDYRSIKSIKKPAIFFFISSCMSNYVPPGSFNYTSYYFYREQDVPNNAYMVAFYAGHNKRGNMLFLDGHVESLSKQFVDRQSDINSNWLQ